MTSHRIARTHRPRRGTTTGGKLVFGIFALAEFERELITERRAPALRRPVRAGASAGASRT
jgi:DNA invertase Pin-like site-specific DNA recombinase